MNLEMLFWATQETGDSIYWKVAVNHANTTMKNHFRPDYSSFHVVDYDPETGEVRARQTAQVLCRRRLPHGERLRRYARFQGTADALGLVLLHREIQG